VSETPTRGILFADLADSSRLYRELGNAAARDIILSALGLAQSVVLKHRGRVVDRIGDELFCVFDDGDAALRAALSIQRGTERARERQQLPARLAFRIGFVHGPVELRGPEVFGDSVYLAKRVVNYAKADQVLTSRETVTTLTHGRTDNFLFVERVRLKGRIEEVELVEAVWSIENTAPINAADVPRSVPDRELQLSYGSVGTVVSRERPEVALGRSATCEIVIDETGVSRLHARVELRRDGFVLIDQSRNGTFLIREGSEPHLVLHEEIALEGNGVLQLGPQDRAPVVFYAVGSARE